MNLPSSHFILLTMISHIRNLRYWSILIAQIFLLFIVAVMKDHAWMRIVFAGTTVIVLGAVINAIWRESKLPRILATISAFAAVVFGVVAHILMGTLLSVHFTHQPGMPIDWMMVVSMSFYAIFIIIAIFSIGRHVFLHDHITSNVIAGGICTYVLIGMGFAFIYATMALLTPGVFVIQGVAPTQVFLSDFFYFSYSTLTTAGFGDITARNQIAKAIASMEAMSGTLFIAIMIAGLVGTYFSQRKSLVQPNSSERR